jgi:cytochrome c
MKRILFTFIALATVAVSAPALADEAMAKAKGCLACHTVDKKLVGPAYKEIAKKYASDASAPPKLAEKVVKGGSGVWGPVPMTPNKVTEAEAKQLVTWILSLK